MSLQRHTLILTYTCIQVTLDLFLPGMKRFTRSLELFGNIDESTSSFQVLGTKVCFTTFRLVIDMLTIEATGRITSSKKRCTGLDCSGEN